MGKEVRRAGWVREDFREEAVIPLSLEGQTGLIEMTCIQNVYKNEQSHGGGNGLGPRSQAYLQDKLGSSENCLQE